MIVISWYKTRFVPWYHPFSTMQSLDKSVALNKSLITYHGRVPPKYQGCVNRRAYILTTLSLVSSFSYHCSSNSTQLRTSHLPSPNHTLTPTTITSTNNDGAHDSHSHSHAPRNLGSCRPHHPRRTPSSNHKQAYYSSQERR